MKFPSGLAYCPRNFVLEISLNGKDWTEVDKQNNVNFAGKEFYENLKKPVECNFARIRNIGENNHQEHILLIYFIEFLGTIFD